MPWIFFIIFGWIIFGMKYTGEKASVSEIRRVARNSREYEDELFKKYDTTIKEGMRFREQMDCYRGKEKQNILNLIQEDLEYIFGDKWHEMVFVRNNPWSVSPDSNGLVHILLLSKAGKLGWSYQHSFSIPGYDEIEEFYRFLYRLEENYQKAGVHEYKLALKGEKEAVHKSGPLAGIKMWSAITLECPCNGKVCLMNPFDKRVDYIRLWDDDGNFFLPWDIEEERLKKEAENKN